MKDKLKKIAEPNSVDSIAKQLRSHPTAFHSTIRKGTIKLNEFQKYCELCDAEIIVRKSDGTEIKF